MIRLRMNQITVRWDSGEPTVALKREARSPNDTEEVLGVRFRPGSLVRLRVAISDPLVVERTDPRVAKIELIHIDAAGRRAPPRQLEDQDPSVAPRAGSFTAELDAGDLIARMATQVNRNLIEARVTITGKDLETAVVLSRNLLHVAEQHVILFIPGVCGSKIAVASHPDENSFPAWSVTGVPLLDEFGRMRCDEFGSPEPGAEAIRTELFDSFEPLDLPTSLRVAQPRLDALQRATNLLLRQTIYNVTEQDAVNKPFNHPELKTADGRAFSHYRVVPWPYDWRLRLEFAVSSLLGRNIPETDPEPGEGPRNLGIRPPSISRVLNENRREMPLMADKIVLAGHSTGGVIMRRLLSEPESRNLVSRANFINVPFFGAPKAYFVFLTGNMLPIIDPDLLQHMAPHLPIVYYLAPTEQFDGRVAVITEFNVADKVFSRRAGQDVGNEFMRPLIRNMGAEYKAPPSMGGWNSFLERKAAQYNRALKDPAIGFENCRIFFSHNTDSDGETTPGHVRNFFSSPTRITHALLVGDGTVPKPSLLGGVDESNSRVTLTPGGPAHDAAANSESVWIRLINDLIGL